jgi:hypothetical protein
MQKVLFQFRVCTLRGDQQINFDAFVQVAGKQILYLRKGDSFEGERLKRLKAKKLRKMYIRVEDEDAYRKYMAQNIEMAYDKTQAKLCRTEVSSFKVCNSLQQKTSWSTPTVRPSMTWR